jgi:hypothetical protein
MKRIDVLLKVCGVLVGLTLVGAVVGGLPWNRPDVAIARKGAGGTTAGYGGGGYHQCKRPCQIKRCAGGCLKARRTCIYCAKQDAKERLTTCKGAATSQEETKQCKKQMKTEVRDGAKACRGLRGQCGTCCHGNYGDTCTDAFEGTSGFGGYFHTSTHYGKVHHYAPDCAGGDSTGGDPCARICERDALRGLRACLKKGGKIPPDQCNAAAEAQRQACLARCGGTTTTTVPPGSAGGGFQLGGG